MEAKVLPRDIDQLLVGQRALIRFSSLGQRTTPEIAGTIAFISADTESDQRSGQSYYVARIAMSSREIARLEGFTLTPGMQVEAFMQTGERKVLSFLLKPLDDQIVRAFRER